MKPTRTKWWLWVPLGLAVVILGWGALLGSSPEAKEKRAARETIDSCWEEQKRKSYGPQTGRLMATICETYESQFQAKYGVKP